MQGRSDDPVAAPGLAAFGKAAGQVQRDALAGAGAVDRPVMRVNAAHPDLDPARADQSRSPTATSPAAAVPVTTSPMPGSEKARSIGSRNRPLAGRAARAASAARALSRRCSASAAIPSPVTLDTGKIGAAAEPGLVEQCRDFGFDLVEPLGRHAVDLGDDPGDLGDADQFEHVEMFEGLRPGAVIGGDDQQHPVDRQHAGQHVRQKPLVPGDIDKPQLGAVRQVA